jgi:hypothetical protein
MMKKTILLLFLIVPVFVFSQAKPDTTWKFEGTTGLNINQASFTNWTAGGINSFAFAAFAKLYANHRKDKFSWNNNLNLMYGMIQNKGENLVKNEDLIDFTSVAGYDISKKWAFTGMVNFKTQFTEGFDPENDSVRISTFMAPAYLTISPAFRYQPVDWFNLYLSPVTAKLTMVLDQDLADIGAFGVVPAEFDGTGMKIKDGENILFYLGPYIEAYLKKEVAKNLVYESKLNVLYTLINRDNLDPMDVDFNWENYLNYQFAKYFSVSFFVHLAYLPAQLKNLQVKQTLGIGVTVNFPSPE